MSVNACKVFNGKASYNACSCVSFGQDAQKVSMHLLKSETSSVSVDEYISIA